jgi:hypothetical protein
MKHYFLENYRGEKGKMKVESLAVRGDFDFEARMGL